MKRAVILISIIAMIVLVISALPALAAKPQQSGSGDDVIEKSNGFPSGPHFNLNIHGKDASTFTCPDEEPDFEGWGNSVFITDDGDTTIYYHSNKKANVEDLTVIDGCGLDADGSVKIQLPIPPQGLPLELQGYHVFARILGKPNNGNNDPEDTRSYIALSPNEVNTLCNEPYQDPETGEWSCPEDVSLGLILLDGVYVDNGQEFYRFYDPNAEKKRGKSKAVDITALFTYTGWVIDDGLDIWDAPNNMPGQDEEITVGDIPVYDWDCDGGAVTPDNRDIDGDGFVNPDLSVNYTDPVNKILDPDLLMYLQYQALLPLDPDTLNDDSCWPAPPSEPLAWDFTDGMWILNIADFVITDGTVTNDGTKLLQVRFYPRWTTEYIPPAQ